MPALNYSKLVQLAKKGMGHSAAAKELGLTTGQISSLVFSQALVESGQVPKAPGTAASIRKLKDSEGNRWELIAARTGKSVAEVKELYEQGGGDLSSHTRGRTPAKPAGNGGRGKSGKAGKAAPAKSAPAGRKGGKAAVAASKAGPAKKARTLAERRAARSANPS
jgi:hypothetical protein